MMICFSHRIVHLKIWLGLCLVTWGALFAPAEENALEQGKTYAIEPDSLLTYKVVGDVTLKLHTFSPVGLQPTDRRAAIVFFYGGGWAGGDPKQFYQHARALTDRGMVAFSAEYRVGSRNKTTPLECVKDAKSAIRWVRAHAAELGVDPDRIVAAGGSAGGHIAACTGIIVGSEEGGEALEISSAPNAMILFNPVLDTTEETGFGWQRFAPEQRVALSPCHHVRPGIVPTIMFHGTADQTVPFEQAERFTRLMEEAGNICELVPYPGRGHSFFNGTFFRPKNDPADYSSTIKHAIAFLTTHGYLDNSSAGPSHAVLPKPAAPYDGSWEALQQMPVPAWFDDGKIGIFIHWGPYSAIGDRKGDRGYAEWVPRLMYDDPDYYYPYAKARWGAAPPEFGYKDIIPQFTAENWDPEAWAKLFQEVGATYVVMTAEHHDGWANWDSDLTPWNAADMGPKRDLVGDLGQALRRRGLKYAPSYHRERHPGFFAKEPYRVHAEAFPDILAEIKRVPAAALLYGPFDYDKAFVDNYVARWQEIQTKYHPDFMWIDDVPIFTRDGNNPTTGFRPEIQYFYDQFRGMITDFMNDAAARGQEVYLNNKGGNRNWPDGVGALEKDNLKLKVVGPKWQSCTTFGTSFGYLAAEEDPHYPHPKKSVEQVIHEMVEIISRNGNFLINIGPRGDGTIPEWQVERLRAMGDWLKINGAAIYGSRYWQVDQQEDEHLSFTTHGTKLYAIKRSRPTAPFVIAGTAGWTADRVRAVRLLGATGAVNWSMTPAGLRIVPPADLGRSFAAWCFEIHTDEAQHPAYAVAADADGALKGTQNPDIGEKSAGPQPQ